MGYDAKLLADSISPDGCRLTSFETTMPRIVLAEFNTHRVFSRNSASSRAIPIKKMLDKVGVDPFIPEKWPKNGKGMQADGWLEGAEAELAQAFWLDGRDRVVDVVSVMEKHGVHKQITNRLLEPFLFHTIIVTATEWENAFGLRRDKAAQGEIRKGFDMIFDLYEASAPDEIDYGNWHLPLVKGRDHEKLIDESFSKLEIAKISCGRCGRVSYLTHDGIRDPKADIAMCDEKFIPPGHMSPLEHAARPMYPDEFEFFSRPGYKVENIDGELRLVYNKYIPATHFCGNFDGWIQMRKFIPNEDIFELMKR